MYKEAYAFKEKFADLQYGYTVTSHKVQGQSHNIIYAFENDILSYKGKMVNRVTSLNSFYVALSRPRRKLVIYNK